MMTVGPSIGAAVSHWRDMVRDAPTRTYTVIAFLLAGGFITLAFGWHTLHYFDAIETPLPDTLNIWHDASVPELVEALLVMAAGVFLLVAWSRRRDLLLLAWSGLLVFIAVDNRFRLHEGFGWAFGNAMDGLAFGPVRGRHLAELTFWAVAALVLGILFVVAWRRRTALGTRVSVVVFLLLCALGFFAVVVDLVHVVTRSNLVGFIEDGGEFLCLAAISAYCFAVMRDCLRPQPAAGAQLSA